MDVPLLTQPSVSIIRAGMPDALVGDVECARVMWVSVDYGGVLLQGAKKQKHTHTLEKQIPTNT